MVMTNKYMTQTQTSNHATSVSVWIKLYIGTNDDNPSVIFIDKFEGNIYQLKEKIKEKNSNNLKNIDARRLDVYDAGTQVPLLEGTNAKDSWDEVPKMTRRAQNF